MKISIKNLFLLIFTFFIFRTTYSQKKQLKILSWNIYMLPSAANLSKSITKSHKKQRVEEISDIMNSSDYDIIVFQEAFHIPSRKKLAKNLQEKFPHQFGPLNKGFIKTNSGIFIVSKIPLKQLAKIQFEKCNSSDCLARKGCGIFEGEINGKTFQILGTHLNSTSAQEIREFQYGEIAYELLMQYEKEKVAQIICGDLNTKKGSEGYYSMLKKLDAEDIETKGERKHTTVTDKVEIDYILLRKNASSVQVIDKQIKKFDAKFDVIKKLHGTLSDHLAVEVVLSF